MGEFAEDDPTAGDGSASLVPVFIMYATCPWAVDPAVPAEAAESLTA